MSVQIEVSENLSLLDWWQTWSMFQTCWDLVRDAYAIQHVRGNVHKSS